SAPELRSRVERTAGALRELSGALLPTGHGAGGPAALTAAVDGLCRHCEHSPRCWDTDGLSMTDALTAMADTLRREGRLSDDGLPAVFAEHCVRRDSFVDAVNREARAFLETRSFRESLQGAPGLLREQVKCFSLVLDDLGSSDDLDCDAALTELLTEAAGDQKGLLLRAGTGRQGRLRVVGESQSRPVLASVGATLREGRGVALADPVVWRGEKGWQFVLSEAPALTVSIERHLSPAPGERVMGDSLRDFRTDNMKLVVALSDGMGAGPLAAGKSRLTVDTLEKLMQAGLREGAAMRILNAALLADNEPEVFATVDAAILDLYSGDLEFVKAGAAPSYILREGRLTRVESRGLPAGVLPELEAQVTRTRVQPGDAIILLSDGLLPAGEADGPLREFILTFDRSKGSLARGMVRFCRERYRELPQDDMTAAVVDVRRYEGEGSGSPM
ncbi:MAG: SpoIIE family protein phosphatase, partial [Clostridia bacterium]|nr:SpoIIE family protein phosphatase [Clostridia bacterium]